VLPEESLPCKGTCTWVMGHADMACVQCADNSMRMANLNVRLQVCVVNV
jgi:hypothetical protein